MSDLPRLNGIIGALESGARAFSLFAPMEIETATTLQSAPYDGVVFEGEHRGWDVRALRDSLQYLLNRRQIATSGSLAPALTPLARIPPNGAEKNQFFAKQALDLGCYGVVWPHVSTVEEAYNAVASCRYPRLKGKPLYEPAGLRGDGPTQAVRYWGVTQPEYYRRADVWPLVAEGEILVIIQIEDTVGIANLPDILKNVPGIGAVLIGEGDLSQELGYPRQYEHKDGARRDGGDRGGLQGAQRCRRAPACHGQERRAGHRGGLPFFDVRSATEFCRCGGCARPRWPQMMRQLAHVPLYGTSVH